MTRYNQITHPSPDTIRKGTQTTLKPEFRTRSFKRLHTGLCDTTGTDKPAQTQQTQIRLLWSCLIRVRNVYHSLCISWTYINFQVLNFKNHNFQILCACFNDSAFSHVNGGFGWDTLPVHRCSTTNEDHALY